MFVFCLVPKVEPIDFDDVGHSTYDANYTEGTGEQAFFKNEQM